MTFGEDKKSDTRYNREQLAYGGRLGRDRTAVIREIVHCAHSKTGKHYVHTYVRRGHVVAVSCECKDLVDDITFRLDQKIGSTSSTCGKVYKEILNHIKGGEGKLDNGAVQITADVLSQVRIGTKAISSTRAMRVRHDLADARESLYATNPIWRREILFKRLLTQAFGHNMQWRCFRTYVGVHATHFALSFKETLLCHVDANFNLTRWQQDGEILDLAAAVRYAVDKGVMFLGEAATMCPVCRDSKTYTRMKGHTARGPHKAEEYRQVLKFLSQFQQNRQQNLARLNRLVHETYMDPNFAKLVETEKSHRYV